MESLVVYSLLGLGSGALFGGLALAAVINYRGSGVLNLALGAIAVLGGYVFYGLRTGGYLFLPPIPFAGSRLRLGHPWALAPAMLVALGICAFTGALLDGIVFRRLRTASALAKLIGTLGLLLSIQAVINLRFGTNGQAAPPVLPQEATVTVFRVPIQENLLILPAIVIGAAVMFTLAYRFTRFGVATRAAQESEKNAMLFRLAPARLSMANTVLASLVAGGIGILAAPTSQLDSVTIPLAVIPALAAALVGKFSSFTVAGIAGIGMGIVYSLITWLQTMSWFPTTGGGPVQGGGSLVIFLILAGVAVYRGGALPERGAVAERRLPAAPRPTRIGRNGATLAVAGTAATIFLSADYRVGLINSEIGIVMCLALVVLTGFGGQVSLMQAGLAGVTALILTKLSSHSGIGFPIGPIVGVAAATVVGVLSGWPTLRARGGVLAVVTMAGAVALSNLWFANTTFGFNPAGGEVAAPTLLGANLGPSASFPFGSGGTPSPTFGFVCLAIVACACVAVAMLRRGEMGERMLAVRSNERAAAAAGISVRQTKLVTYAISSAISGIAGMLLAYSLGAATSEQFTVTVALSFIAFAYIGGISTVKGAIIGGFGATQGLTAVFMTNALGVPGQYALIFGGVLLMVTVVQLPEGLASAPSLMPPIIPHLSFRKALLPRPGSPSSGHKGEGA